MHPRARFSLDESRITFAQLAFPVGTRVAVRIADAAGDRTVSLGLVGWLEGEAVIAGGSARHPLPACALPGAPVQARLRQGALVCTFATKILSVQASPYACLQLAYPAALTLNRVRDDSRVRTGLPALAWADGDGERVPCTIRDLSGRGLRILAASKLGPPGVRVELRFEVEVEGEAHPVALGGIVRHATPATANGEGAGWNHGIELAAAPVAALEAIADYLGRRRGLGLPPG